MKDNRKLAWKIYEALKEKGVEIGNASVFIIEKAIDKHNATEQGVAAEKLPYNCYDPDGANFDSLPELDWG